MEDLIVIIGNMVATRLTRGQDLCFTIDPVFYGVTAWEVQEWLGCLPSVPIFKHTNHAKQAAYHVGLYLNDDGTLDVISTPTRYKEPQ